MTLPAVLITGGAKRLGAAMAQQFAADGWHVVIHYRSSAADAEALATTLPSAETVACDLADDDAAVAMIEELAARLPNWRALINSASIFSYDSVTELDPAANRQAMQVNALSPARMTQAYFANAKAANGRRVIQILDQKLANPNPDFFSYTMSKHALAATIPMQAMSPQKASDRIYGLAPGAILASHDQTEEEAESSHLRNLLQRRTWPDEVAKAAVFLASGQLATGETIYVDSGQHLLSQSRDVIYLEREGLTA
ncbi:SDR family oxidoreductase [Altererythrobacter sp. ZODW24]|uniref:SDR family oxidoreductase n=1 Tax=Altererythrobacter sp. ZODW24 TaxID=2185142 RepID=UPI000DF8466C|nr:SDR family oxidoreductase [Altererythrobacter sp. ZODW24]